MTQELSNARENDQYTGIAAFHGVDRITAPGVGKEFILPEKAGGRDSWLIALIVYPGSSGKVQITISENEPRNWIDWDAGVVIETTTDVLYGVKAVRGVNVSGSVALEVRVL